MGRHLVIDHDLIGKSGWLKRTSDFVRTSRATRNHHQSGKNKVFHNQIMFNRPSSSGYQVFPYF